MKVGGLLVKTLAKPVARQLKVDAEHVGWLREACTSIGQTTNYLTSRLTHASSLDKWKKPYKHIELKATEAREKGAEIVSEGFVLTVAVTVMGYEYNRQNNYKEAAARRKEEKEAERRADVEARYAEALAPAASAAVAREKPRILMGGSPAALKPPPMILPPPSLFKTTSSRGALVGVVRRGVAGLRLRGATSADVAVRALRTTNRRAMAAESSRNVSSRPLHRHADRHLCLSW